MLIYLLKKIVGGFEGSLMLKIYCVYAMCYHLALKEEEVSSENHASKKLLKLDMFINS